MTTWNISLISWYRQFSRAMKWDLHSLHVLDSENSELLKMEVENKTLRRWAVWRRSAMIVILVPTLLSALLHSIGLALNGWQNISVWGHLLAFANAFVLWSVPFTIGLAILKWTHLARSQRILRRGWLLAFALPFLLALVPYELRFNHLEKHLRTPTIERDILLVNFLHSLRMTMLLLPTTLAILPGVVRACLRIKTLLPASVLPGWILVMVPPFYLLLMAIVLIILTQVTESPWLLIGMLCFFGSSMIYVWRADALIRPLGGDEGKQIAHVHTLVSLTSLIGIAMMIYFGLTKEIGGLRLFGIESQTSLLWLYEHRSWLGLQPGEALARSNSILCIGDIRFSQIIVQYCGQSLFMTVVFADALMTMSLSLWRHAKRFETTPDAVDYDKTMSSLQRIISH